MTQEYRISSLLLEDISRAMCSLQRITKKINDPELNRAIEDLEKEIDALPRAFTVDIDVTVEHESGLCATASSGYRRQKMAYQGRVMSLKHRKSDYSDYL